jgi:uncharacterized membrane protein
LFNLPWIANFVHVLFGALWLGGAFFASLVVGPVVARSGAAQREMLPDFAMATARYFRVVGTLAIVVGLVLGWVEHAGGWPPAAALVLAILLFGWGEAVVKRHWLKLAAAPEGERAALIARGIRFSVVEQIGFLVLLALMGIMRSGGS